MYVMYLHVNQLTRISLSEDGCAAAIESSKILELGASVMEAELVKNRSEDTTEERTEPEDPMAVPDVLASGHIASDGGARERASGIERGSGDRHRHKVAHRDAQPDRERY